MHFHVYESVLCGFDQDSGVSAKLPRYWIVFRILKLSSSYISLPEQLRLQPKSTHEMDALLGSLDVTVNPFVTYPKNSRHDPSKFGPKVETRNWAMPFWSE